MSNYELVVFDFDGTLFDSDLALLKVALKMSETFLIKKDVNVDDFLYLNGPSLDESLPLLFPGVDISLLRQKYYDLAPESAKDITLYPGVIKLLNELKKAKVEVAIFTSRSRMSTELILKQNGLFSKFKMIVCGDDGFTKKPSGEGLKHIIDTLKIDKGKTLYVGDNWRDVLAGKDVNVPVAYIKSWRRAPKVDVSARFELNNISEVREIVANERKED